MLINTLILALFAMLGAFAGRSIARDLRDGISKGRAIRDELGRGEQKERKL